MTKSAFRRPLLAGVQLTTLAVIAFLTAGPSAQGLGGVAQKEAERRQKVAGGKRYTNDDLPADHSPTPAVAPASVPASTSASAAAAAPAAAGPGAPSGEKAAEPSTTEQDKQSEEYWRGKAKEIRQRLTQLREQSKAMEGRLDSLNAQLASGAGSSHVQEREVTQKALALSRRDAQYMQDEWNRFETRARSLKIPPAWIE